MGWWGTGVLSGDEPLDYVLEIERVIGVPEDACSRLENLAVSERVRGGLSRSWPELSAMATDRTGVFLQVLAQVSLRCQARMPDDLLARARAAVLSDSWALTDAERADAMAALLTELDEAYARPEWDFDPATSSAAG